MMVEILGMCGRIFLTGKKHMPCLFFPESRYELHAVRLAKLKEIRMGNETVSSGSAYEVEMSEAKFMRPAGSASTMEEN